jgi:hypothetical protein
MCLKYDFKINKHMLISNLKYADNCVMQLLRSHDIESCLLRIFMVDFVGYLDKLNQLHELLEFS